MSDFPINKVNASGGSSKSKIINNNPEEAEKNDASVFKPHNTSGIGNNNYIDNYFQITMDGKKRTSLLQVMRNYYQGYTDLPRDKQKELVTEVMNANPHVYGSPNDGKNGDKPYNKRSNLIIRVGTTMNLPDLSNFGVELNTAPNIKTPKKPAREEPVVTLPVYAPPQEPDPPVPIPDPPENILPVYAPPQEPDPPIEPQS